MTAGVYRTAVAVVELTPADYRHAHDAAHRAGLFWNLAVKELRDWWTTHESDPSVLELRRVVYAAAGSELMRLHSHTRSIIVDDLIDAVATYRENLKAGRRSRAPWRHKNYRPLSFTARNGWIERDGWIILSGGRSSPKISFRAPTITDPATGAVVKPDEWGEGQLCWDRNNRRWEWHVAYRTTTPPVLDPTRVLALDPGIINSFTTAHETDTTYEVTVISGRAGRSIKHRRNTAVAGIVRAQSKCVKGSRRWRKLEAARKQVSGKATDALRNFDHHVARHVTTIAQTADTGRIIAGDVRGIERNTARTLKRRFGRNQRRRLSQWSRGRQERYIAEKAGLDTIEHQNEAWSSKTCPACSTRNRPSGRNYRCHECGFVCHRDAVGALNQHQKATHGTYVPLNPNKAVVVRYLRALPARSTRQDPAHVAEGSPRTDAVTPKGRQTQPGRSTDSRSGNQKPRP